MIISNLRLHSVSVFLLLVTLIFGVYMLTYRAVIQSGDTLRALDAVTSQARYGDWLMDESNWFKPPLIIREDADLPLREYDVEERLNVQLAVPLLRIADSIPRLGSIHVVWLFNLIVTSLIAGLIYFLARGLEFSQAAAALVAVTAGLGTNLWSYAQTFFREPLSALLILAAFLIICHGKGNKPLIRLLSLAAAAAGLYLAFLTKHTALFAFPAAFVFALPEAAGRNRLLQRRLAGILCALAIVCAVVLMTLDPLPEPLRTLLDQIGLKTEFAGAALRSYLLSPGASIWGTSPVLLLSIAGCGILWRKQRYILVLTVCALLASYAIGHALNTGVHWFGGLSWPPRFLLPILPILMLATAPVAEIVLRTGSARMRILWVALLVYGAWIQFNGVALSWSHFGDILPSESQGLAEWLPAMFQPQFFRWVLLPQRWADLGFDFLWTRAQLPIWGISFALVSAIVAWALIRVLRQPGSRWRYASPLLALFTIGLVLLNTSAAYDRDPRSQSAQLALHEVRARLANEARPDDILLLAGNDYGNFALNHLDGNWPRTIVLPRPLAQAASNRQPAQVVSDDPNLWFAVPSLRVIQHLAAQHERLWLLDNTSPFMPWSFRPLERYLAMHYYLVRDVDLDVADDTVRLLEYATSAAAPNPMSLYAGDVPTDLRFGDSVRLLSYTLSNGSVQEPGAIISFSLLWQTGAPLERDFVVATFVADAAMNNPVAQGYDSQPQAGFARTTSWKPGKPIWDNRSIPLPTNVKRGDYRLWVVLYSHSSETGAIQRLPVHGAEVTGEGTIGILPLHFSIR